MAEFINKKTALTKLRKVEQLYRETYTSSVRPEMIAYCVKLINDISPDSVMPARCGEWKETLFGWECTACGKEQQYARRLKFCPNCGANMRKKS